MTTHCALLRNEGCTNEAAYLIRYYPEPGPALMACREHLGDLIAGKLALDGEPVTVLLIHAAEPAPSSVPLP